MSTCTAQELRDRTSELLNTVQFGGKALLVTRHGKPAVRIMPCEPVADAIGNTDAIKPLPTETTK